MIEYDVKDSLETNIVSLGVDFESDAAFGIQCKNISVHVADIVLSNGKTAQVHLSLVTDEYDFIESDIQTVIDLSGGKDLTDE